MGVQDDEAQPHPIQRITRSFIGRRRTNSTENLQVNNTQNDNEDHNIDNKNNVNSNSNSSSSGSSFSFTSRKKKISVKESLSKDHYPIYNEKEEEEELNEDNNHDNQKEDNEQDEAHDEQEEEEEEVEEEEEEEVEDEGDEEDIEKKITAKVEKRFNLRPRGNLKRLYNTDEDEDEEEEEEEEEGVYYSRTRGRPRGTTPKSSHFQPPKEFYQTSEAIKTRAGRLIKRPRYLLDDEEEEVVDVRPVRQSYRGRKKIEIVEEEEHEEHEEEEEEEEVHQQRQSNSLVKTRRSLDLSNVNVSSFLDKSSRRLKRFDVESYRNEVNNNIDNDDNLSKMDNDMNGSNTIDNIDIIGDIIDAPNTPSKQQTTTTTTTTTTKTTPTKPTRYRSAGLEMDQPLPPINSRRVRTPTSRYLVSDYNKTPPTRPSKPLPAPGRWRSSNSNSNVDSDSDDENSNTYIRRGTTNLGSTNQASAGPLPINLNDTEPLGVDTSTTFHSVGGLESHIQLLKEMLILPLVYPEVFSKFKIQPPKGVLFYGPPGTGKTLLARALVNECNLRGGQKVSFFMRKGADCLSKWVGEAERQLRMLFEQAKSMQPSIIFFDEIDGLAPVRSSRQDHIHSSMVSTLLALMDGLDNRGQVVVIGATNRIDSIDPALRRPGRFDRELLFTLPNKEARRKILSIHTEKWEPPIDADIIDNIADRAAGYCGADIKSLASEAVLVSLRKTYPQIYQTSDKLKLNIDSIAIRQSDFLDAMQMIVPSSKRAIQSFASPLTHTIKPLLQSSLDMAISRMENIFPFSNQSTKSLSWANNVYRPRLLICGEKGLGQILIGNALLYKLEEFPVFSIDICSLLADPVAKSIDESCCRTLSEAKKVCPSVLYLPNIDRWFSTSDSLVHTLITYLNNIDSSQSLFIIATIEESIEDVPEEILNIFKCRKDSIFHVNYPSNDNLNQFYKNFLLDIKEIIYQLILSKQVKNKVLAQLPVVPNQNDEKRDKKRDNQLVRQLRILLREVLSKIIYDRKYWTFFKDISIQQHPEYYELIKNPMSVSSISNNLEDHKYSTVSSFLEDIDLIVTNTIEYYHVHDPNGIDGIKAITRAKQLQDEVYSMIDQIDPTLIKSCDNIFIKRGSNFANSQNSHTNYRRSGSMNDMSDHQNSNNNNNNNSEQQSNYKLFTRSARLRGEASEITKEMMDSFMKPIRRKKHPSEHTNSTNSATSPVTLQPHTSPTSPNNTETNEEINHIEKETDVTNCTSNTTETIDSNNHVDQDSEMNDVSISNNETLTTSTSNEKDKVENNTNNNENNDPNDNNNNDNNNNIDNNNHQNEVTEESIDEDIEWYRTVNSDVEAFFIQDMIKMANKKSIESLLCHQSSMFEIIRKTISNQSSDNIKSKELYTSILDSINKISMY